MDLIPPAVKTQIEQTLAQAKIGLAEAQRHNKAVEAQNEIIIEILKQIRDGRHG